MVKRRIILALFSLFYATSGMCPAKQAIARTAAPIPTPIAARKAIPAVKQANPTKQPFPGPAGLPIGANPAVAGARTPIPGRLPVQAKKADNLPKVTAKKFVDRKRKLTPEELKKQQEAKKKLEAFFKQLEGQMKQLEKRKTAKADTANKTEAPTPVQPKAVEKKAEANTNKKTENIVKITDVTTAPEKAETKVVEEKVTENK